MINIPVQGEKGEEKEREKGASEKAEQITEKLDSCCRP
jgi:hypothetical protein